MRDVYQGEIKLNIKIDNDKDSLYSAFGVSIKELYEESIRTHMKIAKMALMENPNKDLSEIGMKKSKQTQVALDTFSNENLVFLLYLGIEQQLQDVYSSIEERVRSSRKEESK